MYLKRLMMSLYVNEEANEINDKNKDMVVTIEGHDVPFHPKYNHNKNQS